MTRGKRERDTERVPCLYHCGGMIASLAPVRSLLLAIFIPMLGAGFLTALVGIRLQAGGTGPLVIGLIATNYFAGLAAGALRIGQLVERIGLSATSPWSSHCYPRARWPTSLPNGRCSGCRCASSMAPAPPVSTSTSTGQTSR